MGGVCAQEKSRLQDKVDAVKTMTDMLSRQKEEAEAHAVSLQERAAAATSELATVKVRFTVSLVVVVWSPLRCACTRRCVLSFTLMFVSSVRIG